jgi:hypothetical protein
VSDRPGGDYAPFVPRSGRRVALGFGVGSVVVFGVLALVLPGISGTGWGAADSLLLLGFGLMITAAMWRFAALRAVPSTTGLTVRNVLLTRTLSWSQIRRVRFAGGDPWVILDLDDGDELAVMAVQKADGERGRREAARLVALVQAGQRPRPGA